MVALSVLVSGLEAEMIRLGYKDSTMVWYRGAWRRLQRYFTARGVVEFSLDVAMEWVDEACGPSGHRKPRRSPGAIWAAITRHGIVSPRRNSPVRGVAPTTTPNQRPRISQPSTRTSTPVSSPRHSCQRSS